MQRQHTRSRVVAVVAAAALSVAVLAFEHRASASASAAPKITEYKFDPRNFTAPVPNKWLPLTPGYQTVREGRVNKGHRRLKHRRVYTVTDVTKEIDGVHAVAVIDQDFDGGELAEQAIDYLALDNKGNVWYLGSYTEAYESGQFVNATDGWLGGVKGAKPGILVKAILKTGTPVWSQATTPGQAPAPAKVVRTGVDKCVPYRCFKGAAVIREGRAEWKYYVVGVGGILTEPHYSGGDQETELLINVSQLSSQGLGELSAQVLKLDQHARSVAKDVFGRSSPAARTS